MKPQGNGVAELHDGGKERGFGCMRLIGFITRDNIRDWDEWHNEFVKASKGQCSYKDECPIYKRTVNKKNHGEK